MGGNTGGLILDHCIAYNNGRYGFRFGTTLTTSGHFRKLHCLR